MKCGDCKNFQWFNNCYLMWKKKAVCCLVVGFISGYLTSKLITSVTNCRH